MLKAPIRDPSPPRARARGRRRRLGLIAATVAAIAIAFHRPLFLGNFAAVDPGRVYRSAQPGSGLAETIRKLGLRSVINLRGGSPYDAFYRHEVEVAERLGVEFYDLPLSATKRPTRREFMLAIAALETCRYPALIHCKWGSDRTGMLSALYRMILLGESPEKASSSFSVLHGHFPVFGPQRLHEPFEEYARWLRERGLAHDPARFRLWVERDYKADDPFTSWPAIRPGPRVLATTAQPSRR